ncbi:GPO family capsid scaffolding protein [Photobacterium halotolerans]|uniref:GPO family capsid scaffolding protein n=1 Tax=Photobacterium halotolerans TaxID=265726 RepID=UPI00137312E4|nr:GPO family capsid scaffolding protein [Photobacterium halotolerans]NAW84932.1 capsid protein [Photobacterium halotolerans]
MAKTSDWKIVATEGTTIDKRVISPQWIEDMAETYSQNEYTAMVWPEHFRSSWAPFDGKNWGFVSEVKAAKSDGKLRLFAKITPNKYLLEANAEGQKLFTSIEPDTDYLGSGKCYLQGLAVTDSPASTGTSMLKFSIGDREVEREVSNLEPLDFAECYSVDKGMMFSVKAALREIFSTGDTAPPVTSPTAEDTDVTEEQLKAALKEQFSTMKTELKTELEESLTAKFSQNPQVDKPEAGGDAGKDTTAETQTFSTESFTKALQDGLKPLTDKVEGLEQKFAALNVEVDGQRPAGEGSDDKMEVF